MSVGGSDRGAPLSHLSSWMLHGILCTLTLYSLFNYFSNEANVLKFENKLFDDTKSLICPPFNPMKSLTKLLLFRIKDHSFLVIPIIRNTTAWSSDCCL